MIRENNNKAFETYAKHAEDNEIEILNSHQCGCFFCRHIYSARDITEWLDENHAVSALCPECGMNTVIGDASHIELTPELLKEMNLYFFGEDERDMTVASTYCKRYRMGKITRNEKNESRYVNYLLELFRREYVDAALELGRYYETGGDFGEPNIPLAISTYRSSFLKTVGPALARAGILMIDSKEDDVRLQAFTYGSLATAMGDCLGPYVVAKCLYLGEGVKFSVEQAYAIASWNFTEFYDALTSDDPVLVEAFVYYSSFMALLNATGSGVSMDKDAAIRYLLFAKLGYQCLIDLGVQPLFDMKDSDTLLNDLAEEQSLVHDEMIFDANTFWDSFSLAQNERTIKKLHVVSFDEKSATLTVEITYDDPVPLIDFSNLAYTIRSGTIKWEFRHVASFSGMDGTFNRLGPIEGEEWGFFDGDDVIARIRYENGQTDKESE